MRRDFRVREHPDTKSVADLTSPSLAHSNAIVVKRRPPGRSINRRMTGSFGHSTVQIPNLRDPVNFGDVKGTFHPSV